MGNHAVQGGANDQPAVFITGSLTGGTGTGIFLDLAYLVRQQVVNIREIYALLLLPPRPIKTEGNEIIYANSYGALRAMQFLNDPANKFSCRWPSGTVADYPHPPFELAQLISQSYNGSIPDIHTLPGLYKIAGLCLFLNIAGLRAKRAKRLIDARGNEQIGKFSTFGLSAIQYPKTQIKEHVALEFSTDLLRRWVDEKTYVLNGQTNPINRAIISNQVKEAFAGMLKDALETLNAAGGKNLLAEIKQEARRINKGDHQGTAEQHIAQLFSSQYSGNWYGTVQNNISVALDSIVSAIATSVSNGLNRHESLYYSITQLNCFADAIEETLQYWKSLGISSQPATWENLLGAKTQWMLANRYQFLFEQDNVLADRMHSTLDLMRFHLFGKTLQTVRDNIRTGDIPLTTVSRAERAQLPLIKKVEAIVRSIKIVLGDSEENPRLKSLRKRMSEIRSDVNDNTIPILRIYPTQTFEAECAAVATRYRQATQQPVPSKEVLMGGANLWDYLNAKDGLERKLYHDCIVRFGDRLESVPNCIQNYNVSDYVRRHPKEALRIAQRAVNYMLPIHDKTLETSRNIPKMVIGSDHTAIKDVVTQLQAENFNEFSGDADHSLEISELKHIMVFYIEQGNFTPTDDISYMDSVKTLDEEYPQRKGTTVQKNWYNFRNPYVRQPDLQAFEKAQAENRATPAPPPNNQ